MANKTASRSGVLRRRPPWRAGREGTALPPEPPVYRSAWQAFVPEKMLGLRQELADPLARNGYALIANSAATGLLGVVYWLLMARLYPTAAVGVASAAYAAMNLLAGFTALNFNGVLTRFIPQAGRETGSLIGRAYLVSMVASIGLAQLFVLTIHSWGPSYSELSGPLIGLLFIACVVAWAIFTLQDSVLIGLRGTSWVFLENSLFGVVKIVLLALLVSAVPHHGGIYISWMLPVIVAVPLINMLIFRGLVPRHVAATRDAEPPTRRQIGRFLAGDYSGAMCQLAMVSLIPVVVAARTNAADTAYFYVAWVIAGIVDMIGINMGMSLTVEGAFESASLADNCRKALRRVALMLTPCAVLLAALAPWWLRVFGHAYATHGTEVLELLAVATLPRAVTEVYLGALRAQNRTSQVAVIQAVRAVLTLGLAVPLAGTAGTVGAAVAVLATQGVVAVGISGGLWRALAGKPAGVAARRGGGWRRVTAQASVRSGATTLEAPRPAGLPGWAPAAGIGALAAAGLGLFFASLRGIDLTGMNGLGLLSVLPAGALAGVTLIALAFIIGLVLPRTHLPTPLHRAVLGGTLAGLVVCLDGITVFIESEPRFPTAYQIAGYVDYISHTGHSAPGLAAYFSWPGFFALVSFVTGAADVHGLLTLLRVWPVVIDLLCLPPLFLLMRNLRVSWRARWLAGFLFTVGNWVGQDYFSPQAFGYLLYIVFLAVLVNWFVKPGAGRPAGLAVDAPQRPRWSWRSLRSLRSWRSWRVWRYWYAWRAWWTWRAWRSWYAWNAPDGWDSGESRWSWEFWRSWRTWQTWRSWGSWPGRLDRRLFGALGPGELPPRQASTGHRAFLLALLIALFTVTTVSHQLTPFFMIGACLALIVVRRCTLTGLPVLLTVILAGYVSFEAVGYWYGHLSNIFGGLANLGINLSSSVGGRLAGSTPTHLLTLHTREGLAAVIIGLAVLGALRRRRHGLSDRVLLALLAVPLLMFGVQSYGGEIALRIYLFMLPAACLLAACAFFPGPQPARVGRPIRAVLPVLAGLAACALVLPAAFFLARYGNEAFEQSPPGELSAMSWVYAHDAGGSRLLWLSETPQTVITPDMPWDYADLAKLEYIPTLAPRNPADVAGPVAALRRAGPGSYLITTQTGVAALQQGASYPPGWGQRFEAAMSAAPGVRVAYTTSSAVVYTLDWPPGARHRPLGLSVAGPTLPVSGWDVAAVILLWAVLALLAVREFIRLHTPGSRLIRRCTLASLPLLTLLTAAVLLRFVLLH
jgi:O-antigen/teichoic acid export membrane protein